MMLFEIDPLQEYLVTPSTSQACVDDEYKCQVTNINGWVTDSEQGTSDSSSGSFVAQTIASDLDMTLDCSHNQYPGTTTAYTATHNTY